MRWGLLSTYSGASQYPAIRYLPTTMIAISNMDVLHTLYSDTLSLIGLCESVRQKPGSWNNDHSPTPKPREEGAPAQNVPDPYSNFLEPTVWLDTLEGLGGRGEHRLGHGGSVGLRQPPLGGEPRAHLALGGGFINYILYSYIYIYMHTHTHIHIIYTHV